MDSSVNPLIIFAQKRQATLDTEASIIQADGMCDDFTTDAMSTKLLLVTKYGLRLHVSHDGAVEISYIPDPQFKRKIILGNADGCNLEMPTLNTVTPFSDPKPSPPFSYVFLIDWGTMHLWYKDVFDSPHVDKEVLEARYPRLAKTYLEWVRVHYEAFVRPECYFGIEGELFPDRDDAIAWSVEGFLLACWLALQDDVWEVQYGCHHLRKGRLEEELVQFLMSVEKAVDLEKAMDLERFNQSHDSSVE